MADQTVRRYELLRRLGSGGMAEVFHARAHGAEGFTKDMVVKRILPHLAGDEEFRGRFIDEAKIVSHLQHRNIVQVIDLGRAADDLFIAMEWIDGVDLEFLLASLDRTPLPLQHAAHITAEVLKGLQFAHSRKDGDGKALGIVHRDVNPPNILISYDGDVKIGDFGVARSRVADVQTTGNGVLGKIGYIAPEYLAAQEADARADLYSVGVALAVMVTGSHPYAQLDHAQALLSVLQKDFPVPGDTAAELGLPDALDDIVRKATARNPEERYPDADAFRHDLVALAQAEGLALGGDAFVAWVREAAPEPRAGEPCSETLVPGTGRSAVDEPEAFEEDRSTDPMHELPRSAFEAPSGLVTLVFSDIEGSTRLWERDLDAMAASLELHNELLRSLLKRHNGYEVKTEGDSFFVAFADPLDALRWCLDAQVALRDAAWSNELLEQPEAKEEIGADDQVLYRGLRVRMGMHLGRPQARPSPTTGRMDYFGPTVNRAARVVSAAYGGQILLTEWVYKAVEPYLEDLGNPTFEDLGKHHLKGVDSELGLYQVLPPEVSGRRFGRIQTAQVRLSNIVLPSTPFVGRESDRGELDSLLDEHRLVTLVGLGGTGKTRLATQYAYDAVPHYRGGAWIVELGGAYTAASICQAVADVLGVALSHSKSDEELVATVGNALAGRGPVLLVLDNFEQLVHVADTTLGRWLQLAPEARFLVTSQAPLGMPEEAVHRLGALPLPEPDSDPGESEAVQLFVQRAHAVKKRFDLTPDNVELIAEIVRELDGLPLAIELAAARMKVFSLEQLAQRLAQRFRVLAGGSKGSGRHETLRKTIQWSWDLLDPWEQSTLAQLSVFQGGFSLEAAEAVVDLSEFEDDPWIPDVIDSLQNRSLIRFWNPREVPDEPRFGMYQSIRTFAAEELDQAAELRDAAMIRHAQYYVSAGREWADSAYEHGGIERIQHLSLERDNLLLVAKRALDEASNVGIHFALEATLSLDPLLTLRGPLSTHRDLLEACVANTDSNDPSRPMVLEARGRMYRSLGDYERAEDDLRAAIASTRASSTRARMMTVLASLRERCGAHEDADALYEEASADVEGWAAALLWNSWAALAQIQGNLDLAVDRYSRALSVARAEGSLRLEGVILANLGRVAFERGDWDRAEKYSREALSCHRKVGDLRHEGVLLSHLAEVDHVRGQLADARPRYERAIKTLRRVGERYRCAWREGWLGLVLHSLGSVEDARALYSSAVQTIGQESGAIFAALDCLAARELNRSPVYDLGACTQHVDYEDTRTALVAMDEWLANGAAGVPPVLSGTDPDTIRLTYLMERLRTRSEGASGEFDESN